MPDLATDLSGAFSWTSATEYDQVPVIDLDALSEALTDPTPPGAVLDGPVPVPVVSVRRCELAWLLRCAGFLTTRDPYQDVEGLRRFARAVQRHNCGASVSAVRRWIAGSFPRWPEVRNAILAVLSEQLGRPVHVTEVWTWLRRQHRPALTVGVAA